MNFYIFSINLLFLDHVDCPHLKSKKHVLDKHFGTLLFLITGFKWKCLIKKHCHSFSEKL
jgi:hypothetical protein